MSIQFAATVILPLLLGMIMFGLGLGLDISDFRRVILVPRAVIIGLACQVCILPLVAFGLCHLFQLPPPLAIGLMVLAASPGGPTSNLYSKISKGDVALNLTLTAVNSAISPVVLPLITEIAILAFADEQRTVGFQFSKMVEVFLLVIIPVSFGMIVHSRRPDLSKRLDRPIQLFSVISLVIIVVAAAYKEWSVLTDNFSKVGWAVLSFNLLSLGLGYLIPKSMKLSQAQAIAIAFEIGIHSAGLALFIAISVLGSTEIAMPAAVYSILMYITAGLMSVLLRRSSL